MQGANACLRLWAGGLPGAPCPRPQPDGLVCGSDVSVSLDPGCTKWMQSCQTLAPGVTETARQARQTSPVTKHRSPSLSPPRTWPGAGLVLRTYSRRSQLLCCSLCAVLLGPLRPSVSSSSKRGESVFLGLGQGLPAWVPLSGCARHVAVDVMLVHSGDRQIPVQGSRCVWPHLGPGDTENYEGPENTRKNAKLCSDGEPSSALKVVGLGSGLGLGLELWLELRFS